MYQLRQNIFSSKKLKSGLKLFKPLKNKTKSPLKRRTCIEQLSGLVENVNIKTLSPLPFSMLAASLDLHQYKLSSFRQHSRHDNVQRRKPLSFFAIFLLVFRKLLFWETSSSQKSYKTHTTYIFHWNLSTNIIPHCFFFLSINMYMILLSLLNHFKADFRHHDLLLLNTSSGCSHM